MLNETAGAKFKDTWMLSDVDAAWLDLTEAKQPKLNRVIQATITKPGKSYLIYMEVGFPRSRQLTGTLRHQ